MIDAPIVPRLLTDSDDGLSVQLHDAVGDLIRVQPHAHGDGVTMGVMMFKKLPDAKIPNKIAVHEDEGLSRHFGKKGKWPTGTEGALLL